MKAMTVTPLQTRIFRAKENLFDFICAEVPSSAWQEDLILVVTSKLLSLEEGRLLATSGVNKVDLIRAEADHYLGEMAYGCHLTVKQGQLIATAGIDESNSELAEFILYPKEPYAAAEKLRRSLMARFHLKQLGILITDSHTVPLRHGVVGSCVAVAGFHPVKSRVGDSDIFGRPLKMTKQNFADALAATAVMMMGEADERRPLALISGAPVQFAEGDHRLELEVPLQEDMYYPLYQNFLKNSKA